MDKPTTTIVAYMPTRGLIGRDSASRLLKRCEWNRIARHEAARSITSGSYKQDYNALNAQEDAALGECEEPLMQGFLLLSDKSYYPVNYNSKNAKATKTLRIGPTRPEDLESLSALLSLNK